MTLTELKNTIKREWLVEQYNNGNSQTKIAGKIGVPANRISELFTYFKIPTSNKYKCKYRHNENYFSVWSANMAYIVGFIMADGWVTGNYLGIELNIKDIEILEFIKNEISPKLKIYYRSRKDKRTGNTYHSCSIRITSEKIINDLAKLYIVGKKSGRERIPDVPKEYLTDFIRGVVDGDGSVKIPNILVDNKQYKHPKFFICSSCGSFLIQLNNSFFENKGKLRVKIENCFTLDIERRHDIIYFLSKIYNGNFCLKRKFQSYLEILEYDKLMSNNKISIGTMKGLNSYKRGA